MSFTSLDIDLIPTNVIIYKKEDNDFIVVVLNKMAKTTDNKETRLLKILQRVFETGESEVCESTLQDTQVKKLENGNLVVFYNEKTSQIKIKKQLNKTEQLLEHQKQIFKHIVENSELSVQGYNDKHEVIYWNKKSEELYGYLESEAMGKKLEDLIIPLFMKEIIYDGIENWIHNDVEIPSSELTLRDKYGNDVNVFSQHIMTKIESKNHEMYCVDIDLKEVKYLRKELSIQKNLLETIFHVIPDLIWLKDTDGVYLYCNKKFEQLYGAKSIDIIGSTDFDFVDADTARFFRNHDRKALKSDVPRRNEEYLVFADGSHEGIFETTKTAMRDEDKNIIGVLGIAHDIQKRKEDEKKLKIYATHDTLTGLANRDLLMNRLDHLLKKRDVKDNIHAVIFIDLDHFKIINDSKGHAIGDKVLIEAAKRLRSITRKEDTLARYGGDEFILLLESISDISQASVISDKILDVLRKPIIIDEEEYCVSASIGISTSPNDSIVAKPLLRYADIAMYKVKQTTKDAYAFYMDS